jgi:hypothetical protein
VPQQINRGAIMAVQELTSFDPSIEGRYMLLMRVLPHSNQSAALEVIIDKRGKASVEVDLELVQEVHDISDATSQEVAALQARLIVMSLSRSLLP